MAGDRGRRGQASSTQPEAVEEVSIEETDEVPAATGARADAILRGDICSDFSSCPAEEFKLPLRPIVPTPEPAVTEYAQAAPEAAPAGVLGEFVSDLEASLGDGFLPPRLRAGASKCNLEPDANRSQPPRRVRARLQLQPPLLPRFDPGSGPGQAAPAPTFTYQPTKKRTLAPEVSPATPQAAAASVDLADMFGELKHELEEDSATPRKIPRPITTSAWPSARWDCWTKRLVNCRRCARP